MSNQRFVYFGNGMRIPFEQFLIERADMYSEKYKHIPVGFTPECIRKMIQLCEDGADWEDQIEEWQAVASELCPLMEKSRQIEASLANPPILSMEVLPQTKELCELDILNAARETNLSNGWDRLKDRFDFGTNFDELKDLGPVSPADLAACMGYGASMSKAGVFVAAKAMLRLQALGFDGIVEQYAAERGLGYSTVSAWLRMEQRIPQGSPARQLLDPTAIAEICNARYSKDEDENKRIREETLAEACEKKVDTNEARSLVSLKKGENGGKQERGSLRERVKELEEELEQAKIVWPILPIPDCSRQDVIDSLRELYADFLKLYKTHESPTTVGFPDYENLLDYLEEHGLPPEFLGESIRNTEKRELPEEEAA